MSAEEKEIHIKYSVKLLVQEMNKKLDESNEHSKEMAKAVYGLSNAVYGNDTIGHKGLVKDVTDLKKKESARAKTNGMLIGGGLSAGFFATKIESIVQFFKHF